MLVLWLPEDFFSVLRKQFRYIYKAFAAIDGVVQFIDECHVFQTCRHEQGFGAFALGDVVSINILRTLHREWA